MVKSVNEIRQLFLDYFAKNGHEVVKSSSLIPHNDPSLLFTNAGMVQFKNYFTGVEEPKFKSAVTAQKCVRAGGKHNDLDNVGYTARHHTFFEMLGNFSFGDYFKEDAIRYAYEFVTKILGLPKDKLIVTVYHTDDEAFALWQKIAGFSNDKIIRIASSDNFWSMGDTGPCGPCSEIFYDHGAHIPGNPPGSGDEGDRFVEIWNLVFMQYETLADGSRKPLPKPAIDTGMGLERVAAIMQSVHNNFEIDLFQNLISAVKKVIGNGHAESSYRVIADHLRAAVFLLADGVFPSNEGRGYVLRRIIRRAMRYAYQAGYKKPLLTKLIPSLQALMAAHYNEIKDAEPIIKKLLLGEEERFGKTLERGLSLLEDEINLLNGDNILSGEIAFKLYDTYGFPVDLTADILRPQNIQIALDDFNKEMAKQKKRARESWQGSGAIKEDKIWFELKDNYGESYFSGYSKATDKSEVQALLRDGQVIKKSVAGTEIMLICTETPFYAESGGQVADKGEMFSETGKISVKDVQKFADGLFVHSGEVVEGYVKQGQEIVLVVDEVRRKAIKANHSATHLLHEALRRVLGKHVSQKGSLVSEDLLRFDFAHSEAVNDDQIIEVEDIVNNMIRSNDVVKIQELSIEQAKEDGAVMLFDEKYGETVRVLTMGQDIEKGFFSKELCGGTHVKRLGDIGVFKIISEGSIASGVRRIEAVTAEKATSYLSSKTAKIKEISELLKVKDDEIVANIIKLQEQNRSLNKELDYLRVEQIVNELLENKNVIGSYSVIIRKVENISAKNLREISNKLISKKVDILVIFAVSEGKVAIVSALSNIAVSGGYDAAKIVKNAVTKLGGKGGGGKANFAQGGASDISQIDKVIADIVDQI